MIFEEILNREYGIISEKIEKNKESTDGNVYIVTSKHEKYVIKMYDNIKHAKAMISLHSYLFSSGFNIPQVIISNKSEAYILSNKKIFVVYSFMKGKHLTLNKELHKIDDYLISSIAKTLRRLHTLTKSDNSFEIPDIPLRINDEVKRYSILHFDLTKGNIFVDMRKVNPVGFIDFDDAKYGPSVCDVAIAIALLFFSKTNGVDLDGVERFIEEYYGNDITLKKEEVSVIKPYALKWIDYILEGNNFDTSTIESFEVKRELIKEQLFL